MLSRVAVATLLLLFQCGISEQGGIPMGFNFSSPEGKPQDRAIVRSAEPVPALTPSPTATTTEAPNEGMPHDDNLVPIPALTPDATAAATETPNEGLSNDPNNEYGIFGTVTPATTEPPGPPGPAGPPLDFDMNAITQMSSFPFAHVDLSKDPFHNLITAQYDLHNKLDMQKCYRGILNDDGKLEYVIDTRMATPLIDTKVDDFPTKNLFEPGLSTVSAFYRNQKVSTLVRQAKVDGSCDSCSCSSGMRQQMVIFEPAFPSRLYCEACASKEQHPTEFYHLQGYNKQTTPNLNTMQPVTYNQLYDEKVLVLPSDTIVPLGAWADPQYSYRHRLKTWKDPVLHQNAAVEERNAMFVFNFPLRPSSIDRFLTNGVPPFAKDYLTEYNADGAVRLFFSPLPTGNARPRHLTLACAQVQSGVATATDSITHVEFTTTTTKAAGGAEEEPEVRHHPEYKDKTLRWEAKTDDIVIYTKKLPDGYKFSSWEVYNKSRFEGTAAANIPFNLRLSVHFSPFSCCSACCCKREECGKKLATGDNACYNLDSTKTRIGHLVLKKIDKGKKLVMEKADQKGLNEFNDLLSQEPFATTGLSLYSQRFRQTEWQAIQGILLDKTSGFGKIIGEAETPRFVESVQCVDQEKVDCDTLAKCRGFEIPKIPVTPDDEDPDDPDTPSSKCVPANIPGLTEVRMEKEHNDAKLKEGTAARVIAVIFTEPEIRWKVGDKEIEMMVEGKTCDDQENMFVDPNKRDLIIRFVYPHTATETIEARTASGASARMNIVVEKKSWLKDHMVWFIVAGVLVVLIIVGVLAFCCWWRCCRKRGGKSDGSTKRKRGKTSKKDSKEGDERSGSDKELTQNPGSSARPAWRVEQKTKKTEKEGATTKEVNSTPAVHGSTDDFFSTPVEREKAETNVPIPVKPGEKDPFLVGTDRETKSAAGPADDVPKTERLSGPIGNQVFGIPTIPNAPGDAAEPPAEAAAAPGIGAAVAAAIPSAAEKESEKEEKSSSKSSSKSDRKGDGKDSKKKDDKKDKKKDSKKKDGKKDKKKGDKKDGSKKKTTKKTPKKSTPKKKSPKKKVSAKTKKTPKKSVKSHKKKK